MRIDRAAAGQRRRTWPWALGLVAVLLALAGAGRFWLTRNPVTPVSVVTVRQATGPTTAATVLNASGYVTARRRATVSSKITGKIVEAPFEEGLPVSRGDVLARLDDAQYRAAAAVAAARLEVARAAVAETVARLELAELTLSRMQRLLSDGIVGQSELDEAETTVGALQARQALQRQEVDVAESELRLTATELADTVIRAPFDGVVISKDAQVGEIVSPGSAGGGFTRTGICTLVDMTSLEIEVDVNESYIRRVRQGQRVEAVLDAYPDWKIPGHVITTIPAADRQKATVLVRIGFEGLEPRILPDMGVKVAFQDEALPAADGGTRRLAIPESAVRRDGSASTVFVLSGERVERRAVKLGTSSEGNVEVLAGLIDGERVVTEGAERLEDGQRARER